MNRLDFHMDIDEPHEQRLAFCKKWLDMSKERGWNISEGIMEWCHTYSVAYGLNIIKMKPDTIPEYNCPDGIFFIFPDEDTLLHFKLTFL